MVNLRGKLVYLRALEPEDLDFVFDIENNTDFWQLSDTQTPYSRFIIKQYLENAQQDIYEAKQLRLVICSSINNMAVGLIDIYNYNAMHHRAGIGIIVKSPSDRRKGIGQEALDLLVDYCFKSLHMHQVYANISAHNLASLHLFEQNGFKKIGLKKDWSYDGSKYHDEYILQRINA